MILYLLSFSSVNLFDLCAFLFSDGSFLKMSGASPCCLATFPFMCLLSLCRCHAVECVVIIIRVHFAWMSPLPLFDHKTLSTLSRETGASEWMGWDGGWEIWEGRGLEGRRRGRSFSCLIFRYNSGMSADYLPCSTSLQYLCLNIAQVPHTETYLWARTALLPGNTAEYPNSQSFILSFL